MKQDAATTYEWKVSYAVQCSHSITVYYNYLKGLWLYIDHYQDLKVEVS